MADGLLCKHCGHCETEHEIGSDDENSRYPYRKFTLVDCPGFTLSVRNKRVARGIERERRKELEWAGHYFEQKAEMYPRILGSLYPDFMRYAQLSANLESARKGERTQSMYELTSFKW